MGALRVEVRVGELDGDPVVDWLNAELEIDAKFGLRKHSADETTWFYRHLAEDICCRELEKTLGHTVPLAGPLDERALVLGTHRAFR